MSKIYGLTPEAQEYVVPGSVRIKLGKILDRKDFGRFVVTKIETQLFDSDGKLTAEAPLLTALPINEGEKGEGSVLQVDDNKFVTNARLSNPNAAGKRCWLVQSGNGINVDGIGY